MIILIGNEGDFSVFIYEYLLSKGLECKLVTFPKKEIDYQLLKQRVSSQIARENNISAFVYIGGEVRLLNRMHVANFLIPQYVAKLAYCYSSQFIYLSSLAALGRVCKGKVDVRSEYVAKPSGAYAQSKQKFDLWLKSNIRLYSATSAIYPASIISKSNLSSSLQKVLVFFSKHTICKCFSINTVISFCDREEIADKIYSVLLERKLGKFVVANNVSLQVIKEYIYGTCRFSLPVPLILIAILSRFFPPGRIQSLLRSMSSDAIYGDASFVIFDAFELSEYCARNMINLKDASCNS